MDELEKGRLRNLMDNVYLSEKVSNHSSGFGFGLTISNILAKRILSERHITNEMTEAEIETYTPGIHFTSSKGIGSEFRFFINITDSESIVAQSSKSTSGVSEADKQAAPKRHYQKIKVHTHTFCFRFSFRNNSNNLTKNNLI